MSKPVAFRCIASSPYGTALSNYTAGYFPPSGCTEKAINRTSLLLEVNNITSRSVHLKWNMSRNEILPCDSFYIIKWVQVENEIARSQTSNKKLFSEKLNLTTLDFTIRSLVPFTMYLISIAVKTTRGENLPRVIRVKTAEDVPTSPTEFKLLGVTSTSCELRWSEPSQPNGLITSYVLHWKRGCNVGKCLPSNQGKILINATGKEMKLNVTDLEPNTAYSMKVAAETSLGEGNYSQSLKVHTKENKMRPSPSPSPSPSPAQSPAPSSTKETVHYIIIGIGVLAAALIFAFVISYYRRRRKGRTFLTTTTNLHGSWSHNLEILFPTDPTEVDEWEYPREKLELENGIDHGEFGNVIKGRCTFEKDGQDVHIVVAIKTLRDNTSEQAVRDFKTELKILKEVNVESHKNIVRLIGACTLEEPTLIITEYCSGGNLKTLLENSRLNTQSKYENLVSTLTEHDLICFAKDITNGMRFIEEKKFVHRDLAARNVLVDEHNVCKLADFGLARNMDDKGQYIRKNANMLPVKWMAIESLEKGIFTSLSDVWSFGVVLYEIVTLGEEPYPNIPGLDVYRHISCGSRMERPKHCSFEVFSLMVRCWETVPEKRPTFCEISEILMDMLYHNTNVYINVTLPES